MLEVQYSGVLSSSTKLSHSKVWAAQAPTCTLEEWILKVLGRHSAIPSPPRTAVGTHPGAPSFAWQWVHNQMLLPI